MRTRPTLAAFAECCALLVKAPRTVREIAELMEIEDRTRVDDWFAVLKSEGLVHIASWQKTAGRAAAVYGWQPSICCYDDAPNPFLTAAPAPIEAPPVKAPAHVIAKTRRVNTFNRRRLP